jgi:outer membrane protein assembly factor BamA
MTTPRLPLDTYLCLILFTITCGLSTGLSTRDSLAQFPAPLADEYQINEIVISGNDRTDAAVIEYIMGKSVGDTFTDDEFDSMWDSLEDCGYFTFVDMDYEEEDDGGIILYVTVEEDRTLRFYPWIAYSLRWKYYLGAVVRDINFRGKGETVDLRGSAIYIQEIRARWERPRFLAHDRLHFSLAGNWRYAPFVFLPTDAYWWDAGGCLRWNPVAKLYVEAGLKYDAFKQIDALSETAPDRGGDAPGEEIFWPAGWRTSWVPQLAVGWDNRENIYYPLRGGSYRLALSHVDGTNFPSYTEWTADLRQFVPLPWRHVVGLRAYGRSVSDPVPIEGRLYWGGAHTLRGYKFGSLVGENGYLLTAEYRAPFFLMPLSPDGQVFGIGAHLFADGGDTWFEGASSGRMKWSWGGGAHLLLATLQLRFEVARTDEGRTVFEFYDVFNF